MSVTLSSLSAGKFAFKNCSRRRLPWEVSSDEMVRSDEVGGASEVVGGASAVVGVALEVAGGASEVVEGRGWADGAGGGTG